ncbi:MAG: hypothetical protein A2147_10575 [Chloroflexi bacterium RBG_16_57_8]|nr:MAG: hypothetical protein A2147_10575 [Chloroflexi bacterium RBG_16_57_8]
MRKTVFATLLAVLVLGLTTAVALADVPEKVDGIVAPALAGPAADNAAANAPTVTVPTNAMNMNGEVLYEEGGYASPGDSNYSPIFMLQEVPPDSID